MSIMNGFRLTTSQQEALDSFREFLNGSEQVFMLKGAAGTGKTTLIREFLNILVASNRDYHLMAPTGRAAFIIGEKCKTRASTIHKAIYQLAKLKSISQNKEFEDDGGLHAKFKLDSNDNSLNDVYIIDEASMVSDKYSENEAFMFGSGRLLQDLFEYVRGRKIVLVGDYAQLPPVVMNFSPALNAEYISTTYDCAVSEYTLREVCRQDSQSGILRNVTKIRDSIEIKRFIEFKLDEAPDCHKENGNLLKPYYALSADKPNAKGIVIAYSNKQVLEYNQQIRQHYYGVDAPRLLPGDLLMIARNNYAYDAELFNGTIVLVTECQSDAEIERRTVRVKLGKDRIESVELRFRKVKIKLHHNSSAEEIEATILDNFLDDPSSSLGGLLARALIVDFNNRLPQYIKDQLSSIKRLLRSKTALNLKQQELYEEYINTLFHDPYYNAVICKYGYAVTCHKAQGGEWENTFVDMCRFGGTANEDYFRWVYTALTRAEKQLFHYQAPEFNYISQLKIAAIQKSPNISISTYTSDNEDFCRSRYNRIHEIATESGIMVSEDRSRAWQHVLTFNENANTATFRLWYKAKGYNGKIETVFTTSDEFAVLCSGILDKSVAPIGIPFNTPDRPFAQKLHNHILSLLDECDIQLLNITHEQYHDVYHLKTDGLAKVEMYYNDKGSYTYMKPISSLGENDKKLLELCLKF